MLATLENIVGNTPLVRLARILGAENARCGNLIIGAQPEDEDCLGCGYLRLRGNSDGR